MFSRAAFTRLQEKNLQVSVSGKAALGWAAGLLLSHGQGGKLSFFVVITGKLRVHL